MIERTPSSDVIAPTSLPSPRVAPDDQIHTKPAPESANWLVGFHGTLQASALPPDSRATVRAVALSHQSMGTQSLKTLTGLPRQIGREAPNGATGSRPVGDGVDDISASVPWWDETEPLSDYLDRRMLDAQVLLLPNRSRSYHVAKRALDIVGASLLLLVSWPLMLILAVLIRLDSPGPAIFRQQRVTLGGRVFTFYKFRTMWVDAPQRYPELYDYRRSAGRDDVYYKLSDDPRNTKVGRWLRRTTMDEMPNLINVLKGDMSLVGPRPEIPALVSHYRAEDLALFFTKAGLTGLAQVSGRSLLTVRERITLDLRYVAQQTLLLDLRILVRTVTVVLLGRGAF